MTIEDNEESSMVHYTQKTRSISVTVEPVYLSDESIPEEAYYVWAYHVTLKNEGDKTVQLVNRYWQITDGTGLIQEVEGTGVVGEQPVIRPGETFEYASGTHLNTPSGMMIGLYEMQVINDVKDDLFPVAIPAFSLDSPEQIARPN